MNENTKVYLKYCIAAIVIIWVGWLLFRDISDNSRTIDNLTEQLGSARAEQRATQESLESIQRQLDNSQRTVGKLEESIGNAESTVGDIKDTSGNIKAAVDNAKGYNGASTSILDDSARRISESQRILNEVREGTEGDSK